MKCQHVISSLMSTSLWRYVFWTLFNSITQEQEGTWRRVWRIHALKILFYLCPYLKQRIIFANIWTSCLSVSTYESGQIWKWTPDTETGMQRRPTTSWSFYLSVCSWSCAANQRIHTAGSHRMKYWIYMQYPTSCGVYLKPVVCLNSTAVNVCIGSEPGFYKKELRTLYTEQWSYWTKMHLQTCCGHVCLTLSLWLGPSIHVPFLPFSFQ